MSQWNFLPSIVRTAGRRGLFACCLLALGTKGLPGEYEKAGEGENLLWPNRSKEHPPSGLEPDLRKSNNPVSLVLAATGSWIRNHTSFVGVDPSPITELASRRKLRDEIALILAFTEGLNEEEFQILFNRLASDPDSEALQLAAATLSTVHLIRYISDFEKYESPQMDQRRIMRRAHKQKKSFPGQTTHMDTAPAIKPWSRNANQLPTIPEAWFTSSDRELVELAMITAALEGNPKYFKAMTWLEGGIGTAAGARLLYLCQQEPPPNKEKVTRMFTDAFRSPPSPQIITRPEKNRKPVKLYGAKIPGGVLACMALGQLKDTTYLPLLLKALNAGDDPVKMEALRALRQIEADDAVQAAFARLIPEAPGLLLPDLCAAIATHPDGRLIPPLLLRLRDETGRFRLDLAWTLAVLTGGVKGVTPEEWIDWWRQNRESFKLDPEASEAFRVSHAPQTLPMTTTGRFYGLPIYSDHLIYVVDTSKSMAGSRFASLRENLSASLQSFDFYRQKSRGGAPEDIWYNLIDFGGDLITMEPGRLVNDTSDGMDRAEAMSLTFGTRSFDAIWQASRLPDVDTLYFLSDGAPVLGQVDEWPNIHSMLMIMYWHRPIAIWAVAFEAGKKNALDMRKLAYANFGLFEEL